LQLLRRRSGKLGLGKLRKSVIQILFASLVMGVFILAGSWLTPMIPASGFVAKAIAFGLPSLTGSIGFLVTLLLVGVLDLSRMKRAMIPWTDYSSRVLAFVKYPRKAP
jgi:hypothetical protein